MKYDELPDNLKSWIDGTVIEHEDGSISVDGRVVWYDMKLKEIPIKFRRVSGKFIVYKNRLTSLENSPDYTGGDFSCHNNRLTSLEGLGEVQGEVFCRDNPVPEDQLLADYRQKRAKKELSMENIKIKASELIEKLLKENTPTEIELQVNHLLNNLPQRNFKWTEMVDYAKKKFKISDEQAAQLVTQAREAHRKLKERRPGGRN